jgi:hypothetical protein
VERGALAGHGKVGETPLREAGTGYQTWLVHSWVDSGERTTILLDGCELF